MKHAATLFALLLLASVAAAQVSVPYATATLSWSAAPETPTQPVDEYEIQCGTTAEDVGAFTVTVPKTVLTVELDQVVPSPGVYVCGVASANIAGVGATSPLTPPFVLTPPVELPEPPQEAPIVGAGGS